MTFLKYFAEFCTDHKILASLIFAEIAYVITEISNFIKFVQKRNKGM